MSRRNNSRTTSLLGALSGLILLGPTSAWAQDAPRPVQYSLGGQLVFWVGAFALVVIVGRLVFKEQLNERRTLRRLIREIGPFYPEFDIDRLKHWVYLCAPHVWAGWKSGEISAINDFITDEFGESFNTFIQGVREEGQSLNSQLFGVLKVHPLGLYMVGPGPAPRDVELMLRLEQKAVYCVRDKAGKIIEGRESVRQIQHFWTLRHDGVRLRLHQVWLAERDVTDLAARPAPPVITEWASSIDSNPKVDS